jgi:hypothetical protein
MSSSLLVLDDVDQLCAGSGPQGYSNVMLATLRALLRSPPTSSSTAKAGGHSKSKRRGGGKSIHILAATSRSDAACNALHEIFDETIGKKRCCYFRLRFNLFSHSFRLQSCLFYKRKMRCGSSWRTRSRE